MHGQEFATAVQYGLPILVVLLDNAMAPRLSATAKKERTPIQAPAAAAEPTPAPAPAPVAMISPQEQEFRAKLKELRDHLTKNADNVGAKFPEEATELSEEGIEFHAQPRRCRCTGFQGAFPAEDQHSCHHHVRDQILGADQGRSDRSGSAHAAYALRTGQGVAFISSRSIFYHSRALPEAASPE